MSDAIGHECGIALIRLLKPLEYYPSRYGVPLYGLSKLHLLMEKQHNRGQDGAGAVCIKTGVTPGKPYLHRIRSNSETPIADVFRQAFQVYNELALSHPKQIHDVGFLKENMPFCGELYLGHLRYGTFGKNNIENLHPVVRHNNWMTRNLALAGNFNLTNVDELFGRLVALGQYPVATSDTVTILEKIGHYLDEANEALYKQYRNQGFSKKDITPLIATNLDVAQVLRESSDKWDGGYVIAGLLGHGDAFVLRDPNGIRPAFYYANEEVVVAASERPVIQTTFNVHANEVKEIDPGHALVIKCDGTYALERVGNPVPRKACSFERIYFSRGTDTDIYTERKKLGRSLARPILDKIGYDIENTVFSYIPNTAASAFSGLVEELDLICDEIKIDRILEHAGKLNRDLLKGLFDLKPRSEKVAVKDIKLRTFITQDARRDDLVAHVYDITYGTVRPGKDNLVVLDDSIVRGTTLKQSILRMLDRLGPKKIVIASSAPQIRYPDCYGIDMAKITDFVAFQAAIALLKETHQEHILHEVYRQCKAQEMLPKEEQTNAVKAIYAPFTAEQISARIAQLVTPANCQSEITLVFQTIESLHESIPNHTGDWYFTGNYPTPGGNKVVNRSFVNYIEGRNERAY